MKLTLTYLFPQSVQSSVTYAEATGVPIPVIGDHIGSSQLGYAYVVNARTWVYSGIDLTIYFACS